MSIFMRKSKKSPKFPSEIFGLYFESLIVYGATIALHEDEPH
jgi:hypothetical protein